MHTRGRRRKLPRALRRQVVGEQWGLCDACGEALEERTAEIDHIVPVAVGGSDARENLHALCPNCHARKTRSEDRQRRRARACGPGVALCWVCGDVFSTHFGHACSGIYWYAPKK